MGTNNGKQGGLLKGKPHYDKNGNSLGGIKAVITDSANSPVELEGGEVIINKAASEKHWKELSKINQSAGGGVPIVDPSLHSKSSKEYGRGGGTGDKIEFNANHTPNKWVYEYAKKLKENYPKVWALGGNEYGNEAFKNLERAFKRGHWIINEEWMYVKWQSFNARHKGDFRIAGVIANLKWLNKVEKGWDYMKTLIDKEIQKRYPKGWRHNKNGRFKAKMNNGGGVAGEIKKGKKNKNEGGDCYEVAGRYSMDNMSKKDRFLVHAQVVGQGSIKGLKYGHAWIEDEDFVYEMSNGRDLKIDKKLYYMLGVVDEKKPLFYRYTFKEAVDKMVTTGHFGPWDLKTETGL